MRALLIVLALMVCAPAQAVQPDEILDDPVKEERAREISKGLRCLVCRNEAIDDSNAELARTLRLLVRERIVEGDSDDEVLDYVVDRYGEYVLLKPRFTLANALIWLSGPVLFAIGGWLSYRYIRARSAASEPSPRARPLSDEEQRRLDDLLGRGA